MQCYTHFLMGIGNRKTSKQQLYRITWIEHHIKMCFLIPWNVFELQFVSDSNKLLYILHSTTYSICQEHVRARDVFPNIAFRMHNTSRFKVMHFKICHKVISPSNDAMVKRPTRDSYCETRRFLLTELQDVPQIEI